MIVHEDDGMTHVLTSLDDELHHEIYVKSSISSIIPVQTQTVIQFQPSRMQLKGNISIVFDLRAWLIQIQISHKQTITYSYKEDNCSYPMDLRDHIVCLVNKKSEMFYKIQFILSICLFIHDRCAASCISSHCIRFASFSSTSTAFTQ